MGYFTDIGHESRRQAYLFLQEASERFSGEFAITLAHAAEHYRQIGDAFHELNTLFPWSQLHAPIEDLERRRQAVELLKRIKQLDMEGLRLLEKVY